ncbi:MAG: DUF6497 family protein [Paracoccaceae bacterium]
MARDYFNPGLLSCTTLIASALFVALPAAAQQLLPDAGAAVAVPSGQQVSFVEAFEDPDGPMGLTLQMRFVAPGIARAGGTVDFETAAADMQVLCDALALPYLRDNGLQAMQIVIALSDMPVVFGQPTPEATQFIEAYSIEGDTCIWEVL